MGRNVCITSEMLLQAPFLYIWYIFLIFCFAE